jgi:hypothetical protein
MYENGIFNLEKNMIVQGLLLSVHYVTKNLKFNKSESALGYYSHHRLPADIILLACSVSLSSHRLLGRPTFFLPSKWKLLTYWLSLEEHS